LGADRTERDGKSVGKVRRCSHLNFLKSRYVTLALLKNDFPQSHFPGDDWAALNDASARLGATATPAGEATLLAWGEVLAHRYFSIAGAALTAADPHHLNLGHKFLAAVSPSVVVLEASRHIDVVSVDFYDVGPVVDPQMQKLADIFILRNSTLSTANTLEGWYRATGKPLLIAEFGYRAMDSGLPNTFPPGVLTLPTQKDRAACVKDYLLCAIEVPWVLGAHFFEFPDEPSDGRFDGENSNWGLVNAADKPCQEVIDAIVISRAVADKRLSPSSSKSDCCVPIGPQK
jgi:hypothetical protein